MNPQTIINETLEIGRRLNVQMKNKKHEEKSFGDCVQYTDCITEMLYR